MIYSGIANGTRAILAARANILKNVFRERMLRRTLNLRDHIQIICPMVNYHGGLNSHESIVVRSSFLDALTKPSNLPEEICSIPGPSGQKYRSFINRLISSISDPRYLEIGSWKGSTAAAALRGNRARALCIDNWSQFGGPRSEFLANINKSLSSEIDFTLLEEDFRAVDYSEIGTFNVYMFDGPHAEVDHYDGIVLAQPALSSPHILVVDDWNWRRVRLGTLRAFRNLGCNIEYAIELRTTLDDSHGPVVNEKSEWHNGYFIAVIRKQLSGSDSV